ncbi:uncharacterized protein BJ171DRAFT_506177 [Polychytrium aggregatum]|uniref:uncharacterized protein n=1 Tax=Polychytrium aggregatum TaxID=110093 RepID=UPI0022FECC44|nr:uncharacterized protein BJ171DRAFT_506177 [Polychytrium aggregatum]KAI9204131.1 hypothetical protein BJ171DRAFT_506177 [Polychytrium aggregatum]
MDYILRRCSICFDANLDFFLQNCKDQFCKSCFQRYVHENVKNSWGLVVQPIKCPVCSDVIPKNEWERYVDAKLVRQFERNNKPFRPFIRHCDSCRTDICCAESPVFSRRERKQVFGDMYALLQRIVSRSSDRQILDKFQTDYKQSLSAGNVDHVLVYKSMIKSLKDIVCARYRGNMDAVEASPEWSVMALFSRRFTAIEMQASQWNTLQFLHVSNFPRASCASCSTELCFLCGEQYHPQKSCHEHMQDLLAHHEGSEEVQANLSWKLENSKRCPSCCILITRDEGCNKVSCLYCGYQFCWVCCGKFNDGDCGFYKCSLSLDEPDIPPDLSDFQTELGVPDMTVIGAKLKL